MSEVHRREFLQKAAVTGVAVGGATWAVPSILGFEQAFALGSTPPSVTAGGYVRAAGNASLSVPAPTGTFFVLVVATENVNTANVTASAGWTARGNNGASGLAPSLFVFTSTSPGTTLVTDANATNDKFSAEIFGFTGVTSAVLGTFGGSTGTSLSVPGVTTGSLNGEYLLVGTSVASAGGWTTPSGFNAVDYGSQSNTPDIKSVLYSARATSVPTTAISHTSAASTGFLIGLS